MKKDRVQINIQTTVDNKKKIKKLAINRFKTVKEVINHALKKVFNIEL